LKFTNTYFTLNLHKAARFFRFVLGAMYSNDFCEGHKHATFCRVYCISDPAVFAQNVAFT